MTDRRQSKPRHKWAEQMNADLLSCKREAVAMTRMEQPSLDGNGKKKGDGDLGLSSQNSRDQAARLEKTLQESTRNLPCDTQTEGAANLRAFVGGNLSRDAQVASSVKQCWFEDDASGAGSITEIKKWWDILSTLGPDFWYIPTTRNAGLSRNQPRKKMSETFSRKRLLMS